MTDLATLKSQLPATQVQSNFNSLVSSDSFLPRIQLCGGNSSLVTEGKVGVGIFAYVKGDNIDELGKEFNCVAIAMRGKAMEFDGGEVVTVTHDQESEEFLDIRKRSTISDSGCTYGPEYLLVLEDGRVGTYYFSSKSARKASPELQVRMESNEYATFKSKLIKTKKYKWHAPDISLCSTPFDLPDDLQQVVEDFLNPKDVVQDTVSEDEAVDRQR